MNEEKIQGLFNLVKDTYGFKQEDYSKFAERMQDPKARASFHKMANEDYSGQFKTLEEFESNLGIKKKEEVSQPVVQPSGDGLQSPSPLEEDEDFRVNINDNEGEPITDIEQATGAKERNPLKTFWDTVKNSFVNTIPAAIESASAALTPPAAVYGPGGMPPSVAQAVVENRPIREVIEEEQEQLIKGKQEAIKFVQQKEKEGAKLNTVRSLSDINDTVDLINFAATAAAEAGVQIPLALATGGLSSAMQSIGQVYSQGVQQIAEKEGISTDEVIAQGKDDQLTALLFGTASGMLDRIGAKGVKQAITPKNFASSLRKKAKDVIDQAPGIPKAAGTEGITEMLQTAIEQVGGKQAGGSTLIESIQGLDRQQLIDAGAMGAIGGGLGATAGRAASSVAEKVMNTRQANEQLLDDAENAAAVDASSTVGKKNLVEEPLTDQDSQDTKTASREATESTQQENQPVTQGKNRKSQQGQPVKPEQVNIGKSVDGPIPVSKQPESKQQEKVTILEAEKKETETTSKPDQKPENEQNKSVRPNSKNEKGEGGRPTLQEEKETSVKVQNVRVEDLSTDEKRFQNRENAYSEKSVQSIIKAVEEGTFDIGEFDPVRTWTDPQDNKKYVLAGHSRREAFSRLNKKGIKSLSNEAKKNLARQGITNFKSIPAVELSNKNEADAIAYATERSNALSTAETELEGATLYRRKREAGEVDSKIKDDLKGRANLQRLKLLSHLNPSGNTYDAISATQQAETSDNKNRLIQIGEFIGEARQKLPQLTNAHENELYRYLSAGPGQKITQRRDFVERLERVTGDTFFDPAQPLNLENRVTRGTLESEANQKLEDTRKRIRELEKERDKENPSPGRLNEISRDIQKLNKDLYSLTENVRKAKMADRLQMDIFSPGATDIKAEAEQAAETVVQNAINPLQPIYAAVAQSFRLANKVQDRIFGTIVNRIEDALAKAAVRGITSRNKFFRSASAALSNLMGGLLYTEDTSRKKMSFQGGMGFADKQAERFYEDAIKIVDSDPQSMIRVHRLLDPEAYSKREDLQQGNLPGNVADLNDAEKMLFALLRQANEDIHEYHYQNGLIDEETYQKNKGKYIARLYEESDLDQMPEDVTKLIEQASSYGRTKINTDIFRARKDIAQVKKSLIQDPVYLTSKRISQMLKSKAILEYADQISNIYEISQEPRPGYTKLESKRNAYGALTGKYVPNFVAEDFKGFFFADGLTHTLYEAFKIYDRTQFRQFLKKYHTVFSPHVQLGNVTSNLVFSFVQGIDPLTMIKNSGPAYKQMKSKGEAYLELVKAGILGTDFASTDLLPLDVKAKRQRSIMEKIEQGLKERTLSFAGKLLGKADQLLMDTYSGADEIAKLSAYLSLTKDYGVPKEKAIQMVYDGFQNYAMVGKAFDFASKTPVIGNPYVKFAGDLARILKNATTKRPLTSIGFLYTLRGIADLSSTLSGESEEEKKAREKRKFIPKIKLPISLPGIGSEVPLVFQTPAGEINVARFISPYYIYDIGDTGLSLGELTRFLPYQVDFEKGKFAGLEDISISMGDVFLGTYAQVLFDKDFRGKSIKDPEANRYSSQGLTSDEMLLNQLTYIARNQIPFFKSADDLYRAYKGEADYYDRERNLSQAIVNNFIKIQEFGPEQAQDQAVKSIQYYVRRFEGYNQEIAAINNAVNEDLEKVLGRQISPDKKENLIRDLLQKRVKRVNVKLKEQTETVQELEALIQAYQYDFDLISPQAKKVAKAMKKRNSATEEIENLKHKLKNKF